MSHAMGAVDTVQYTPHHPPPGMYLPPAPAPVGGTCRQVITPDGVEMKSEPCFTTGISIGGRPPNTAVAQLEPGSTVTYINTDTKQTSACGATSDPQGGLGFGPWVKVGLCTSCLVAHGWSTSTAVGAINSHAFVDIAGPSGNTLCWIQAKTDAGKEGWIPVARGTFLDPFCGPGGTAVESLVTGTCGERC
jgi:hypothetical protein